MNGLPRRRTFRSTRLLRRRRRRARRRTSAAAPSPAPRCRRAAPRCSARRSALSRRSSPQPRKRSSPGLIRLAWAASAGSAVSRAEDVGPERRVARSACFSSRPQPGQKSSLVTNSFGRLAGSFFFVPGSALRLMMSFSSLISLLLEHHVEQQRLELVGERLRLRPRVPPLFDHLLPLLQVRIELRRLGEELQPAIEQLVIELLGRRRPSARPPSARRSPSTPPACTSTPAAPASRASCVALGAHELVEQLLLLLDLLVLRVVLVDDRLRRQRILVVRGVEEHAGQRVVVLRRNRVVLVIVAAGAADGQAEEAARRRRRRDRGARRRG